MVSYLFFYFFPFSFTIKTNAYLFVVKEVHTHTSFHQNMGDQ